MYRYKSNIAVLCHSQKRFLPLLPQLPPSAALFLPPTSLGPYSTKLFFPCFSFGTVSLLFHLLLQTQGFLGCSVLPPALRTMLPSCNHPSSRCNTSFPFSHWYNLGSGTLLPPKTPQPVNVRECVGTGETRKLLVPPLLPLLPGGCASYSYLVPRICTTLTCTFPFNACLALEFSLQ